LDYAILFWLIIEVLLSSKYLGNLSSLLIFEGSGSLTSKVVSRLG
jgi:hypothetical protein